ncbi:MAG: transcriptional repressor [Anaerolineae bacterium]|nr:transcriptional repressor [Anaerolineae bacterium]
MITRTDIFVQTLRQAGLRLTPQRLAICRLLATTARHPTAQMIYDALRPEYPSLSLATVYNTLDVLVQLNMIHALGSAGDDAEHYDGNTDPHINLACISCHRVIDLEAPRVQTLEEEVAANSGYHLLGARVMYYGLCPECQQRVPQTTEPATP